MFIKAEKDGDAAQMAKLVQEINRDGRREHLTTAHVADAKALFAYLAQADGRRPFTGQAQCSDPLRDESGARHFDPGMKCSLLAAHFEKKLGAPTDFYSGIKGQATEEKAE